MGTLRLFRVLHTCRVQCLVLHPWRRNLFLGRLNMSNHGILREFDSILRDVRTNPTSYVMFHFFPNIQFINGFCRKGFPTPNTAWRLRSACKRSYLRIWKRRKAQRRFLGRAMNLQNWGFVNDMYVRIIYGNNKYYHMHDIYIYILIKCKEFTQMRSSQKS